MLTNPPLPLIQSLPAGDDTYNDILQLTTILNRNEIPVKTLNSLIEQPFTATAANIKNIPKLVPPTPLKLPPSDSTNAFNVLQDDIAQLTRVLEAQHPKLKKTKNSGSFQSYKIIAAKSLLSQHIFDKHNINYINDCRGQQKILKKLLQGKI